MSKQLVVKQVMVTFYLLLSVSLVSAEENFAKQLLKAYQQHQPTPHYSQVNSRATESNAYQVQRNYVQLRQTTNAIAGYKAGLTSRLGQQKFNVNGALSGVLFTSGLVTDPRSVSLANAGKLMLETEIGFVLGKPILTPLTQPSDLKQYIQGLVAVIELPDLSYHQPEQITGNDLIAANLASHQFIVGQLLTLEQLATLNLKFDINQIDTHLALNQQRIMQGKASDALGDQWQALFWLVNHLLAQNYPLESGHLLITGALWQMLPAQLGEYQADFAQLGKIDFRVIE